MSAIDIHTHAFPDNLAKRAISSLEKGCPWKAVGKGTIESLLKSMDEADIDVSVVCTIATRPGQAKGILEWCKEVQSDRIDPLPSVHPDEPDAPGWIARIADAGFVGVKLHPMYQSFALDDPRMDGIYSAAAENELFIAFHCGQDIAFPPDDDRASPERLARVLDRFPELVAIATHLGGWRAWDQAERSLVGREVHLETSFSFAELGPDRARDMIRRHGAHRVLFGTDWPWQSQADQTKLLSALGLDEGEKQAVLWSNGARLLGY